MGTVLALLGNSHRKIELSFPSELRALVDRNILDRARVVDLSSEGYSVPQITEELRRARNYVLRWIDRFNNEGISGL
jgi:hypothetical protein